MAPCASACDPCKGRNAIRTEQSTKSMTLHCGAARRGAVLVFRITPTICHPALGMDAAAALTDDALLQRVAHLAREYGSVTPAVCATRVKSGRPIASEGIW